MGFVKGGQYYNNGGNGGGGRSGTTQSAPISGVSGTGGGGGGDGADIFSGAMGGSGIVIIRYRRPVTTKTSCIELIN